MKLKLLAAATMFSVLPFTLQASDVPNAPHVITSGVSSIDVQPDMAILTISVTASAKKASDAKDQVDQNMAKYFEFLTKNGIDRKDINAANIRTQAEYDYNKNGTSTLKGYRAERQVKVTLRQLDKLNSLLDGALKAGLNEISNIQLGVAKPETYQDIARKQAIEKATLQAKVLAEGFGAKLGPIYRIQYHVADEQSVPVMRMKSMNSDFVASSEAVSETYDQQMIKFTDNVDVVFELQR